MKNIELLEGESFVAIKGYTDYYISNYGRVYSAKTNIIRKNSQYDEYSKIILFKNGKYKSHHIHRLVAEHFVNGRNDIHRCVNHIDSNKYNNSADNLEWCSYSENQKHYQRNKKEKK